MPDHAANLEVLPLDIPQPGEMNEVAPGLFWLRMPLPLALNHVNLWVLEDGDGWCLIDTGMDTAELRAIWQGLLEGPLAGRPVTRLIVTHFHPDHAGLAGWLWQHPLVAQNGEPSLQMTALEYLMVKTMQLDDTEGHRDRIEGFYNAAGMAEERVAFYRKRGNNYRRAVHELSAPLVEIADGDVLTIGGRRWDVITAGGHCLDMATLHCAADNLYISADQVLPFISPNVSVWPLAPYADPLAKFKTSLTELSGLPGDSLVLPCHGVPFHGLHPRITDLLDHHEDRLGETVDACGKSATANQVSDVLFNRPLDDFQRLFALGETLAHLNNLVETGALERIERPDAPWIYQPTF